MSVVVMGMDKPKLCMECDFQIFSLDGDIYCKRFMRAIHSVHTQPPDWCPLRPLPEKHGRLGDLDAIMKKLEEDKRDAFTKHDVWLMLSKHGAPAIIEAEGGSDA